MPFLDDRREQNVRRDGIAACLYFTISRMTNKDHVPQPSNWSCLFSGRQGLEVFNIIPRIGISMCWYVARAVDQLRHIIPSIWGLTAWDIILLYHTSHIEYAAVVLAVQRDAVGN